MAFDGVPWMIGGGEAEHTADVGRQLAYMASSGTTGITNVSDLRVTALPTPGASVRIGPGGGPIANTYPGGAGQSYVVRNPESTDLPVPATGSGGGATRYVIVRIDDPQYNGGQYPADRVKGPYVRPALVSSVSNLTYPHMVLAKITQPASTATITQSMITDLREVAIPRTLDVVRVNPIVGGDTGLTLTATRANGEAFPNAGGTQLIDVPVWATRAQIRAYWTQVRYPGGKNHVGKYWVEYGPGVGGLNGTQDRERATQRFSFNSDTAANVVREQWIMADDVYIPAAYRGTTQNFVMKAKNDSANTGVAVDVWSGVFWEVRFLEVADPSTT